MSEVLTTSREAFVKFCLETHEEDTLLCPICEFDYMHFVAATVYPGGTGGRLDVNLDFLCENGHNIMVTFHQHKGQTTVWAEEFAK